MYIRHDCVNIFEDNSDILFEIVSGNADRNITACGCVDAELYNRYANSKGYTCSKEDFKLVTAEILDANADFKEWLASNFYINE